MTTEALLTLTQWFSPSYPVGAFAYSHGLETVIQDGTIKTAADVEDWLKDVLQNGTGRNDCVLIRAAYDTDDITHVDATARAFAASAERIAEAETQGIAFAQTTAAIWDSDATPLLYPVAVGHAAKQQNLPVDLTATLYLQSFLSNLVSAAIRAIPLGQTEGQAVLTRLTKLCPQIVAETAKLTIDDLSSTTFLSDIAAMRHETLHTRIFRS
ncbi:urease accessory protein UreF [Yoonia sp. 2307UL14-13]|uniref:urease accessory protein UreF n=1 Tax=Yoonia sp. 2307UL14-13 TaxID=3126506 RepID=UPI00309E0869